MIEAEGLRKRYGEHAGGRPASTSRSPAGTHPRRARAQRRRQVDDGPHAHHHDPPRRRHGPGRRASTWSREAAAGAPRHRRDRPGRHPRRAAHRHPEPRAGRRAVELSRRDAQAPGRASCSSASSSPTPAGRMVKTYSGGMRRRLDLAASLDGATAGAVPRRADHRPRPHEPAAHVGGHPRASSPTAPPCCSPRSTSTRPTRSPTASR